MLATVRFEIFSADLNATATFYTDVLAFEIVRDDRAAEVPYLALERDGIKLGAASRPASPSANARQPPIGVELVLEVDDIERERERIAKTGWEVAEEMTDRPWGLRDFRLLDPDGYYWRITSRETDPPASDDSTGR